MVIDTMVFAYALLGVEQYRETALEVLKKAESIVVPDTVRAELANVLWQWVQRAGTDAATAYEIMEDAEALFTQVVSSQALWPQALTFSIEQDHPVYDTLFVTAAEQHNMRVVTFDQRMRARFPEQTLEAGEYLSL
ncbi:type II toxin-antitoxin system VapC family toxin [Thiohalophilus sp.]|uniref:type II toxin-antitoxin system VapC family toxin n=1 Tax=Thiohalophilus sp. TaxID=3028392 RepID=UPI002ACE7A85|nr:type II toxin-antitoxin system VapC family toxin [Thiohalophilus sp.]MDZ7804362.1 type II toxin-antitoxin system VapC family toxin [Thiohalophilus sp.]